MFSTDMQRTINYIMAVIIIIGNLVILNYISKIERVEDCRIESFEMEFIKKYLYGLIFANLLVFLLQMARIA